MKKTFMLFIALIVATGARAQRADNYPPTNDKTVQITSTNLPIVFINVGGKMILRDERITARMKIISNGTGKTNYGDTIAHPKQKVDYDGYVSIKYRGNTSFTSSDKKPYGFKTINNTLENGGKKQKVKLLGMGKDNDWVLLAPFADKTMLRDVLTYELGRPYFDYTPHSRYCEVVVDGIYYGVYILAERPGKGKNRMNLNDPGEDSGDLTGDYHVQINRADDEHYYTSQYHPLGADGRERSWRNVVYEYKSPEYDDFESLPAGTQDSLDHQIYMMEQSFTTTDYTNPDTGYRQYIDVTSFIDYMLSTEFSFNIDGYRLSTNMYKYSKTRAKADGLDSRWKMTLWDFNIAYGNANYHNGSSTDLWSYEFNSRTDDTEQVPFWWSKLMKDPSYVRELKNRWKQYRQGAYSDANISAKIDSLATILTSGGAIDRNEKAWKMFGRYVWPNAKICNNYADELAYMKNWISNRVAWLDAKLLPAESDVDTEPVLIRSGYNCDVVAEGVPAASYVSKTIDGQNALLAISGFTKGCLPADGSVASAAGITYQMADYDANNALMLAQGESATLYFYHPTEASALYLLATSGSGSSTIDVQPVFGDGSTGVATTIEIPSWQAASTAHGTEAVTGLGRISTSNNQLGTALNCCLYENRIANAGGKKVAALNISCQKGANAVVMGVSRVLTSDQTAVENVRADHATAIAGYYTIDGMRLSRPQRGICIVRYSDGSARKVVVK